MAQDPDTLLSLLRSYSDAHESGADERTRRDAEGRWLLALNRFLIKEGRKIELEYNAPKAIRGDEAAAKILEVMHDMVRSGKITPHQFESGSMLAGYIKRRLRWFARDQVKRNSREQTNLDDLLKRTPDAAERSPEGRLDYQEFLSKLEWALKDLGSPMIESQILKGAPSAKIIKMRFFDGKTLQEIANELGFSVGYVHKHMNIGLRALRAWFRDDIN